MSDRTWSKSIRRSLPMPERSSMCAAWLPTPCGDERTQRHRGCFSRMRQSSVLCCEPENSSPTAHPETDDHDERIADVLLGVPSEELDVASELRGRDERTSDVSSVLTSAGHSKTRPSTNISLMRGVRLSERSGAPWPPRPKGLLSLTCSVKRHEMRFRCTALTCSPMMTSSSQLSEGTVCRLRGGAEGAAVASLAARCCPLCALALPPLADSFTGNPWRYTTAAAPIAAPAKKAGAQLERRDISPRTQPEQRVTKMGRDELK